MLVVTRSVVLKSWGAQQSLTSSDKTKASAIAGGVSGMVGGLLRMLYSYDLVSWILQSFLSL